MPGPFDLAQQNLKKESKIVIALERISEAFRVLLWKEAKEYSLSPIQIQILIFLQYHSPEKRKVGYLALEFNMTKATISDAIKVLEAKKLIYKETELNDSRSYNIHLTDEGKAIVEKSGIFTNLLEKPIDNLSEVQKQVLLESLSTLIFNLQKAGIISHQRMCQTCSFYRFEKQKHFCNLISAEIHTSDLRLDCPEHSNCE